MTRACNFKSEGNYVIQMMVITLMPNPLLTAARTVWTHMSIACKIFLIVMKPLYFDYILSICSLPSMEDNFNTATASTL